MPPTPSTAPGSPLPPHLHSGQKHIVTGTHVRPVWQGISCSQRSRLARPKPRSASSSGRMASGRLRSRRAIKAASSRFCDDDCGGAADAQHLRAIKAASSRFCDGVNSSRAVARLSRGSLRLRPRSDQSIIHNGRLAFEAGQLANGGHQAHWVWMGSKRGLERKRKWRFLRWLAVALGQSWHPGPGQFG